MKHAGTTSGLGTAVPPSVEEVVIYFGQQSRCEKNALDFCNHYKWLSWRNPKGLLIRNWKQLAWQWIWYRSEKGEVNGNRLINRVIAGLVFYSAGLPFLSNSLGTVI